MKMPGRNEIERLYDAHAPVLFAFLLGWLPTYLIMRARLWTLRRRVETFERNQAAALGAEPPLEGDGEPVI